MKPHESGGRIGCKLQASRVAAASGTQRSLPPSGLRRKCIMFRKRRRVLVLATAFLSGGVLLQFGSCAAGLVNFGLSAIDFCALTGTPDCTIGPFAPCGRPDFQLLDQNGLPTGNVINAEDDLLVDCPVTFIQPATP